MLLLLLPLLWGCEWVEGQRKYYPLKVERRVTVQEGLCVHVPCKFSHPLSWWTNPNPAHGYWFQQGDNVYKGALVATNNPNRTVKKQVEGRFHLLGDLKTGNCSLSIRAARKRDVGTYFFRVERGDLKYTYTYSKVSVNVTGLIPDILILGTLESGHPSNLTCSVPWACEQGMPHIFSWLGTSLFSLGPDIVQYFVFTLTPRTQDHGTNLTSEVTLPGARVIGRRTVHLNVSYESWAGTTGSLLDSPQNLTVTASLGAGPASTTLQNGSSLLVPEGQPLRLLCVVNSHPPSRLRWTWGNLTLQPMQLSSPGVLELSSEHLRGEGEFTCHAQNSVGSQHICFSLSLKRNSAPMAQVVLVAIVEVAVKILLLGLCLIFLRVRMGKKRAVRPAAGVEHGHDVTG